MANPGETTSTFTVIQFSLESGENDHPVQRSRNRGSFTSVEEAFQSARCCADDTWRQIRDTGAFGTPAIVDTEWGYDLRLGPLTVHRFWVHEDIRSQRVLQ